jgi:beta-mannosidase
MSAVPYSSTPLSSGWKFTEGHRNSPDPVYLPANDVPTEVYRDLLKNGKIADPFKDLNELSVSWVGDRTWTYRTTFAAPADHDKPGVNTTLRCEGLDTFATVYLNNTLLFNSDNMFVEYLADLSGKLIKKDNKLEIVFEPARMKDLTIIEDQKKQSQLSGQRAYQFIVHQTDISRGPVRKAQYHWGWDWGPILMTCGPWKPMTIET